MLVFFFGYNRIPFLMWENVKLFENSENTYTIIAGGYECPTCKSDDDRIYASVMIIDPITRKDLLLDMSEDEKRRFISFFAEGIRNLTNDNEFYNKFWGLIKN